VSNAIEEANRVSESARTLTEITAKQRCEKVGTDDERDSAGGTSKVRCYERKINGFFVGLANSLRTNARSLICEAEEDREEIQRVRLTMQKEWQGSRRR
jgi:hypothetical protein